MKKKIGFKYLASGVEAYQPGSRRKVLRNLPGIASLREMEDAELAAYMKAERELAGIFTANHRFVRSDIDLIHKKFLGGIYPWAGKYRTVNLSKGGFVFASALAIPRAMKDFGRRILAKHTPCHDNNIDVIAADLAAVHAELLLTHPYREGNGRTARLLATLMAYQAGMPGLDFGFIGGRGREFNRYIAAIHAALTENYRPMTVIMRRCLTRALKRGH